MATIKIPPVLRASVGGEKEVERRRRERRRRAARPRRRAPADRDPAVLADGELNRYVNVYLNDEDVRVLDGLDTPVGEATRW